MSHPDLPAEQRHLDHAYASAALLRDRALRLAGGDDLSADEGDAKILRIQFKERARAIDGALHGILCFGRIDEQDETFHIGRTHIESEDGKPLVIDWRSRSAIPFYRATFVNPLNLDRRRRFMTEDRLLVDIMEEDFNDPDGEAALGASGVPDPLLAELGRTRTGRMRDIAATIQTEQDVIIRSPLEQSLIVQGGPGTGKTAVALHRAAFLLFEHRDRLTRDGVLIIGPNRLFLEYISQVLPTLGEGSVRQTTIETLLGSRRVTAFDTPAAAAVKADARMAEVIRRACLDLLADPKDDMSFPVGTRIAKVSRDEIQAIQQRAVASTSPWSVRRSSFRNGVLRAAYESLPEVLRERLTLEDFAAQVQATPGGKALDACWRTIGAEPLIRKILTNRRALERASTDVLNTEEQQAILRKTPSKGTKDPWTRFDLPLLDEADVFIGGYVARNGHVVVDEAQDRTPMELRAIGRRAAGGSMTVLGDLAQATAVGSARTWQDVSGDLALQTPPDLVELTIGYRLPGAVLEFANRLLPVAAPHVTPSRSVRETGDPPVVQHAEPDALLEEAATLCAVFAKRYSTTAIIVAVERIPDVAKHLQALDVAFATEASRSLEGTVAVLSPSIAKGLEFDAVIVVEPNEIVANEPGAERALFVALTRAVQHLCILHSDGLPELLRNEEDVAHI